MISPSIFKSYDIRGIYPKDINEKNFPIIIQAIYKFFENSLQKQNLTVVLGRDMRLSSPQLFDIAEKTLVEMGATVIDIGLASTPTVYFAVFNGKYDAGIQISASHNPKEYNGIKLVQMKNNQLVKISDKNGINDIRELAIKGNLPYSSHKGKIIKKNNIVDEEVKFAINMVKPHLTKTFKVVVDPANAMGIVFVSKLFEKIPVNLVKMNFDLDGSFPAHQPSPLEPKNLRDLQKRVIEEKADLGLSPDGDGDRVFFVDEKGKIIQATSISSLLAKEILQKSQGEKVIVDIRYLKNVTDTAQKFGGHVAVSRVGHSHITKQLNDENAIFAGESSGHFYFRETGGAECTLAVILYILQIMQNSDKPISQIVQDIRSSYESGEFNFTLNDKASSEILFQELKKKYANGTVSEIDGIAISFPTWRFGVRSSNTEPLVRLNVEGNSKKEVEAKSAELQNLIISVGAKLTD